MKINAEIVDNLVIPITIRPSLEDEALTVYLKLWRNPDNGGVTLVACEENGTQHLCGNLLTLGSDGVFKTRLSVSEDIGLPLDGSGRIIIRHGDM